MGKNQRVAEENLKSTASKEECIESYERMFQLDLPRDINWTGEIFKMVFIQCLKRHMISEIK